MRFNIIPPAGTPRTAASLALIGPTRTSATLDADSEGMTILYVDNTGQETTSLMTDTNTVAEVLAQMIARHHQDHSLLVYAHGGTSLRGDEGYSAEVFPPGQYPRIVAVGTEDR